MDDFTIENLRLTPEMLERLGSKKQVESIVARGAANGGKQEFCLLPRHHLDTLRASEYSKSAAVLNVLLELVWLDFKERGRRFKLSNKKAKAIGISRHAKTRALLALAELGIVTLEGCAKKSPWITLN
jgi:hypothetical protein